MAEVKPTYRRLPGTSTYLLGVLLLLHWMGLLPGTRLWYAEDHLLQVNSVAAFESYRRYYFREIKALIVQPTAIGLVWNVVLGVLLAAFVTGAVAFWVSRTGVTFPVGTAITGGLAAWTLILLVVNVVRGKTCRVFVQTKAGVERLGAPVRLPAARRVREILAPKIRADQAAAPAPAAGGTEEARAGAVLP